MRTTISTLQVMIAPLLMLLLAPFLFVSTDVALAGPPLLCHPIEIGNAESLPSGSGPFGYDQDYNREHLIEQTLELLSAETPIIVRMETLRRATLYATKNLSGARGGGQYSEEDRRIAFELLTRIMSRALESGLKKKPEPLAWFDTGYLMQCYEQAGLAKDLGGIEVMKRALALRGDDPDIHFALALMTAWPARGEHDAHLRKARAGARKGTLLARNLVLHFPANGTD